MCACICLFKALFKQTERPSKEVQQTIAQQLGLDVSTVANFFMNARRRANRWRDINMHYGSLDKHPPPGMGVSESPSTPQHAVVVMDDAFWDSMEQPTQPSFPLMGSD